MWEYFKHKIAKLGCFFAIALAGIAVAAITKMFLLKLGYSSADASHTASSVGDYVGKGVLTLCVVMGFVLMGLQLRKELRTRSSLSQPPPLPISPTPSSPRVPSPMNAMIENPCGTDANSPKARRSLLFKGCLVLAGLGGLLAVGGIGTIYYLADQYEKQPKKPGQAECDEAEKFVLSYKDREGVGNTPEATKLAEGFSRKLRVSRQIMFTEGRSGGVSLSKGFFLTYCFVSQESVALIVHVPDLRNYSNDAQITLSEYAWTLATDEVRAKVPKASKLAVAVRGVLNYSAIMTGRISNDEEPLNGLVTRHPVSDTKPLWPFFVPDPPQ
jgi:hypothetical protein